MSAGRWKGERVFNALFRGCGIHWLYSLIWLGIVIYVCNTQCQVPPIFAVLSGFGFAVQSNFWVSGGCSECKTRGGPR